MRSARLAGGSVLVLVWALLACDGDAPSAPSEALTGITWQLQAFQTVDEGRIAVPQPERYTLLFATDGGLDVRADCNTCVGSYRATSVALTIDPALACTEAYCGDDSLDFKYLEALGSVSTYALPEDALRLHYAHGTLWFSAR